MLVTHESFFLPKKLVKAFEQESGYDLVLRASGDAGTMTNKLVLSAGNPQGDVAYGVDNTFASRALDNDVFAPYDATLPAGADDLRAAGRRRPQADAGRQRQRVRQHRHHVVRRQGHRAA